MLDPCSRVIHKIQVFLMLRPLIFDMIKRMIVLLKPRSGGTSA